jgi:ABC-2 type transport system permease protein
MNKSLFQLTFVHFKTFFREPAILFWAVFFPIIMAWVLGVAFSGKGETIRTVFVVTQASSVPEKISGEKVVGQETGNAFRIKFEKSSEDEAIRALKRGVITLYIEVRNDSIVYHFDPHNPDAQLTHLILEREVSGINKNSSAIEPLATKGTRYIDFLIPGLIALGIMNSCIWGIGWSLIEMRMKKLLRRMVATPMSKSIFLVSQMITRVILGTVETLLLLIFAWLYFDLEITGSFFAFAAVFLSGIFAFAGIAIMVASRTGKTEVANGLVNAVTLPMMILSGVFFNYHNFPDWAVPVIQVLPLTMLADAIRSIFIEAAGIADVFIPIIILLGTGLVTFVTGLKMFKWY